MKLFSHVAFWVGAIMLLTLIFGSSYDSYADPFFFVLMLLPVVVGTSYFFNNYLVPKFLLKKKIFKFILYSFYMLIISLFLEMVIITLAFILLANYQYENMIPLASNAIVLAITLYCVVFLFGFLMLAKRSIFDQNALQSLRIEKETQIDDYLLVRANRKTHKIFPNDVDFLESLGDYVKINIASSRPIITKEKISKLEEKLPDYFLRIHRSYIININKIHAYNKEEIQINDASLPISRSYKKHVIHTLSQLSHK